MVFQQSYSAFVESMEYEKKKKVNSHVEFKADINVIKCTGSPRFSGYANRGFDYLRSIKQRKTTHITKEITFLA